MTDTQILQLEVFRGTDFACQLFWTGPDGEGIDFTGPARADVRDATGAVVLRFIDTTESPDASATGVLTRSATSSVVQLTAASTVTSPLAPGRYKFDVLVTLEPTTDFPTGQLTPIIGGWVAVLNTQTDMEA